MVMKKYIIVILIIMTFSSIGNAQEENAEKHFQLGKKLIEVNCGDCMDATRKGLEDGIAELLKSIEMGYPDKIAVYKLIADAYNTLAFVYAVPDSKEQKEIRNKQIEIYKQILRLDPRNQGILYQYALTYEDTNDQLIALQEVLKINPDHADARFAIGILLVQKGQLEDGIKELKKAVDLADSVRLEVYGNRLVDILIQHGRKKEAEEVSKELQEKIKKLEGN